MTESTKEIVLYTNDSPQSNIARKLLDFCQIRYRRRKAEGDNLPAIAWGNNFYSNLGGVGLFARTIQPEAYDRFMTDRLNNSGSE